MYFVLFRRILVNYFEIISLAGFNLVKRKVNVFLPMRAGSERIFEKNTKTFANIQGGLCKIKLEQLILCDLVENIIISTNDHRVTEISNYINSKKNKSY